MLAAILLPVIPCIFLLCWKSPERALLLWLLVSPFSAEKLFLFGVPLPVVTFDRLAFLAVVLGLVSTNRLRGLFQGPFSKLEKAIAWFLLAFILDAFLNFRPRRTCAVLLSGLEYYGIAFFIYLLAKHLLLSGGTYNEGLERRLATTLAIVGAYCAAMSIFEGTTGIDLLPYPETIESIRHGGTLREGGGIRTNGPFKSPEVLGQYLSLTLLLSIYRWRLPLSAHSPPRPPWRLATVPVILLYLVGLFFNKFRSIWLGFLGGCLTRYARSARACLMMLAALVFGAVALWLLHDQLAQSKFYAQRIGNTDTVFTRFASWKFAFQAFGENPVLGIGYNRLAEYIGNAQERGENTTFMDVEASYRQGPHNTIILALAEFGLLGTVPLVLVGWYFLLDVRSCVRLARTPAQVEFGYFAAAIAFAVLFPQMFDRIAGMEKHNNLVFVLFALVTARLRTLKADSLTAAATPTVRPAERSFPRPQSAFGE